MKTTTYGLMAAMLVASATPTLAQDSVDNSADAIANSAGELGTDIANGAGSVGGAISNTAGNVAEAADNAVDIDVNSATPADDDLNLTTTDDGLLADDPLLEENLTTTTAVAQTGGDKGNWGLLGLAGLLAFLFRPKQSDVFLDERDRPGTRV